MSLAEFFTSGSNKLRYAPASRPSVSQVASIELSADFSGEEAGCGTGWCGRIGWLQHSRDGRFVYVGDGGDVIDTTIRRVVATLPSLRETRKMLEIDWKDGVPVAATPREGIGCVEAPRGLLTHHYITDENGIVEKANLIVGTTHQYPAIQLSVATAARELVKPGVELTEPVMNMIEMAFRAYDPCFGCATHALPGAAPLEVRTFSHEGELVGGMRRNADGTLDRVEATSSNGGPR